MNIFNQCRQACLRCADLGRKILFRHTAALGFPRLAKIFATPAELGVLGENAAACYLAKKGYFLWKTNWSCPLGELDIIAHKRRTLVFVEVKTRSNGVNSAFAPFDAITRQKEGRIRALASLFIHRHAGAIKNRRLYKFRFDAIGVYVDFQSKCSKIRIEHEKDLHCYEIKPARFACRQ